MPRPTADERRLRRIVLGSDWFVAVLKSVRRSGLPDAWVGAGAVRDLVWDSICGTFNPAGVRLHFPARSFLAAFTVVDGRIVEIDLIADSDKLRGLPWT